MSNHNTSFVSGFTLIELLIVIMVIVLFSGMSLAFYNQNNQTEQLKSQAKLLSQTLSLAKQKAVSGDLSGKTCTGGFNGYEIYINTSSYDLYLRCGGVRSGSAIHTYKIEGASVSTTTTPSIIFNKLTASATMVDGTGNPVTQNTITFTDSAATKCIHVTVYSSGIVKSDNAVISC